MKTEPVRLYRITFKHPNERWGSEYISARSRGQAISQRHQAFRESYDGTTYVQFKALVTCGLAALPPADDGYAYVRRVYKVDPRIGQRARLVNEGASSGKEGVVAYPGQSTAHVHIIFDDLEFAMQAHPFSVELLEAAHG